MAGIFISYRREDTGGYARSLSDSLAGHFGEAQIFRDIDTLGPGVDFPEAIAQAVGSCDVLLALIGDKWLTAEKQGQRRLDNPRDYVRLEISAALERDILVIPILLEQARMPAAEELPEALAELADRNALRLTDDGWKDGIRRLIAAIEQRVRPKPATGAAHGPLPVADVAGLGSAVGTGERAWASPSRSTALGSAAPPMGSGPTSTQPWAPSGWSSTTSPPDTVFPRGTGTGDGGGGGRRPLVLGGLVVAVVLAVVVGLVVAGGGDDDDNGVTDPGVTVGTVDPEDRVTTTAPFRGTLGTVTVAPVRGELDLTLSPTSGPVGTVVTVSGSGFDPNERVDIRFHTERVAQARADAQGSFSPVTFEVPNLGPFRISFTVTATGASSIKSASAPFRVT